MNENKKDMIRPFEIATEKEQFIKPFTIGKEYQGKGNDISKDTEKTNQEDVQENNQFMMAPFIRVLQIPVKGGIYSAPTVRSVHF